MPEILEIKTFKAHHSKLGDTKDKRTGKNTKVWTWYKCFIHLLKKESNTHRKEKNCILRTVYMTVFQKIAFLKAEKNRIQIYIVRDILKIKSKDSNWKVSMIHLGNTHTYTHPRYIHNTWLMSYFPTNQN